MEDSGFKTTTNYPINNQIIDIYGTLETSVGEVAVVAACKNYEEPWTVGLDVLKDMESAAKAVNASKILIFTTSRFTHGAAVYAQKRNIKLVDKKGLMKIAQNYSKKQRVISEPAVDEDDFDYDEYYYESSSRPASLNPNRGNNSHAIFSGRFNRSNRSNGSLNQYRGSSYNHSGSYLSNTTTRAVSLKDKLPAVDVDRSLEFFKKNVINFIFIVSLNFSVGCKIQNKITELSWKHT